MSSIYMNHMVVVRSPGKSMKRASPTPARHTGTELSDEEMPDYENVSVTPDKNIHKPPAEVPPIDQAPAAPSTWQPAKVRIQEQKHLLVLYILMAVCLLMGIALLSHAVVKDLQMTGEIQRINVFLSKRIDQVAQLVEKTSFQLSAELEKYKEAQKKQALHTAMTTASQS